MYPFPHFRYFTFGTPTIPDIYWNSYSYEERIKKLCMEYAKLIVFTDSMVDTVNDQYEIIEDMQSKLPELIDEAVIEEVRKKIEDGTFVPMLQEAIDEWLRERSAQVDANTQAIEKLNDDIHILDEYCRVYDTVADMKSDETVSAGMICHTNGFHSVGDSGAAWYAVSESGIANEMDIISMDNMLFANLVKQDIMKPEQFGAYADDIHDDTSVIQYMLDEGIKVSMSKGKTYLFTNIKIDNFAVIEGNNATMRQAPDTDENGIELKSPGTTRFTISDLILVEAPTDSDYNALGKNADKAMIYFEGAYSGQEVAEHNDDNFTDMKATIDNVFIMRVAGDGFVVKGRGMSNFANITVWKARNHGFVIGCFDSNFIGLDSGATDNNGIEIDSYANNVRISNSKAWGAGYFYNTDAYGWHISGNKLMLSNCEAQDCYDCGFYLGGNDNVGQSLISDSCGTVYDGSLGRGRKTGNTVYNYDIVKPWVIDAVSSERSSELSPTGSVRIITNATGTSGSIRGKLTSDNSSVTWQVMAPGVLNLINNYQPMFPSGIQVASSSQPTTVNIGSNGKRIFTAWGLGAYNVSTIIYPGINTRLYVGSAYVSINWNGDNLSVISSSGACSFNVYTV